MVFDNVYRDQVALLIRTLPYVAAEDCLALKGGTAINLFYREMPRLSVDVDLTYLYLLDHPDTGWHESATLSGEPSRRGTSPG